MAVIGGPWESITLDGRTFAVAQDSGPTLDLGGDTNTIEMNGNETFRIIKEKRPGLAESINVESDPDRGDLEFLKDLQEETDVFPVSVTKVNGTVYSGACIITDPVVENQDKATAEIKLAGRYTKQ